MTQKPGVTLEEIAAFMKGRGFIYPSSEIYGGLSAAYDYGPLGVELKRNIMNLWWKRFVTRRNDVYGLDTAIFMNPKVWEASGHTQHFTDPLIECKKCHKRHRPDKLVEDVLHAKKKNRSAYDLTDHASLRELFDTLHIVCPDCGAYDWTDIRDFNTLFETYQGVVKESENIIYLRGEIAQGMFVNFKNIQQSMRAHLPFGIAQQGKAFRNEVTVKRFIFRTREFNLMEIEYFVHPDEALHALDAWKEEIRRWYEEDLGIKPEHLHYREQTQKERAHYSAGTFDLEYDFFWGADEIGAVANRTDFDLSNHQKKSGVDLSVVDMKTQKKVIPFVIEPTFGIDRSLLATFVDAYEVVPGGRAAKGATKHEQETVLHLKPSLAPIQVAVLPLSKKSELVHPAEKIVSALSGAFRTEFDTTQSIGKRYRRQDEIGTPYCVTFDFDSVTDQKVTVRDRDTMQQERVAIGALSEYLLKKIT